MKLLSINRTPIEYQGLAFEALLKHTTSPHPKGKEESETFYKSYKPRIYTTFNKYKLRLLNCCICLFAAIILVRM